MSEERKQELEYRKKILYGKLKDLIDDKNKIEARISGIKAEYYSVDRELAEMRIIYCQSHESGKVKLKPVTLSMSQVQAIADKLGIKLEDSDESD